MLAVRGAPVGLLCQDGSRFGHAEGRTMRIVSWNIQWGRGADGIVNLARTRDTLARLGTPELICLQEVAVNFAGLPGGPPQDGLAWLSAAFPDYEAVYAPGLDVLNGSGGGRSRFGNLLLSRLPVLQAFRHLLPWPADPKVPSMQRACAEVVVEAPAGPLRILTTHLEYYSQRQRMAQVEALRSLQAEAAGHAQDLPGQDKEAAFAPRPRPASAILCGDLNLEPGSPEYLRLGSPVDGPAPGWTDAWAALHPGEPHAPSVGLHGAEWPDRSYCCDFFFVTTDLLGRLRAIRVEADTAASDHQPVVLDID
jgi:endonuclease/exonuclease/phosphatase family metal-dependent hydrolase